MPPTVYMLDRRQVAWVIAGAVLMTAASVWMLVDPPMIKAYLAGPPGVVLFGCAAVVHTRRLLRPAPELTVTDEGFVHRTRGRVEWWEVDSMRLWGMEETIVVEVFDEEAYKARSSRVTRLLVKVGERFGMPPVCIWTRTLTTSAPDVLADMQRRLDRFIAAESEREKV